MPDNLEKRILELEESEKFSSGPELRTQRVINEAVMFSSTKGDLLEVPKEEKQCKNCLAAQLIQPGLTEWTCLVCGNKNHTG